MPASDWAALSARDANIVKYCYEALALGSPATYTDSTGTSLAVFEHRDWEPMHIAILGVLIDNLASIDAGYTVPMSGSDINRVQLASDILTFCNSNGLVAPTTETTFQQVLDAQGVSTTKILMGDADKPDYAEKRIFCVGDSKTAAGNSWPGLLKASLTTEGTFIWGEGPPRFGVSGYTAALMVPYIDTNLDDLTIPADFVLINLGSNDVKNGLPVEATWKADMTHIVDACLTKWPSCVVYVAKAWRTLCDANCDTMATWVDEIVATYASQVFVGHDENVWFENGDNGATYAVTGVHYNEAGEAECAAQWQTVMGY